jgi:hypothetical protein
VYYPSLSDSVKYPYECNNCYELKCKILLQYSSLELVLIVGYWKFSHKITDESPQYSTCKVLFWPFLLDYIQYCQEISLMFLKQINESEHLFPEFRLIQLQELHYAHQILKL